MDTAENLKPELFDVYGNTEAMTGVVEAMESALARFLGEDGVSPRLLYLLGVDLARIRPTESLFGLVERLLANPDPDPRSRKGDPRAPRCPGLRPVRELRLCHQ